MKRLNKSKYYTKTAETIKSCLTYEQLDVAETMVENFTKRYGLTASLEILLTNQHRNISLERAGRAMKRGEI